MDPLVAIIVLFLAVSLAVSLASAGGWSRWSMRRKLEADHERHLTTGAGIEDDDIEEMLDAQDDVRARSGRMSRSAEIAEAVKKSG